MYFVNQQEIEQTLRYIESLLEEMKKNTYASHLEKLALERMIHMLIEAMIDVGNMMIDGFIMRDPGSYEDIIDILVDERVLPEANMKSFKEFFTLRNMLIKQYMQVDHQKLAETYTRNIESLESFSTHIRIYLKNELGVAHAFSNHIEGDER